MAGVIIDRTSQTTPPTYKLSLVRGDTLLHTFSVSRTGFDFTSTTARCQFKKARNSSAVLFESVPLVTFPELGKMLISIRVDHPHTLWQAGSTCYADVELTLPGNLRKTVNFLDIEVLQDVTG